MKDGDTNKDFLSSKRFDFFKKFYSLTANYFNWHYFIKKLLILHSLSNTQFCHGTSINETNCCSTIMEINNENTSNLIVNIHGLLGEQDGVQIEFEEDLLVENGEFILDEVRYQIVRIINEDVECPLVYVLVLDIINQT